MGAFTSCVLPEDQPTIRVLLKIVIQTTRWITPPLCVGDLMMARRQLLNLKQLTEHHLHHNVAVDQLAGSVTVTGEAARRRHEPSRKRSGKPRRPHARLVVDRVAHGRVDVRTSITVALPTFTPLVRPP